jgi:hypothetical protein
LGHLKLVAGSIPYSNDMYQKLSKLGEVCSLSGHILLCNFFVYWQLVSYPSDAVRVYVMITTLLHY